MRLFKAQAVLNRADIGPGEALQAGLAYVYASSGGPAPHPPVMTGLLTATIRRKPQRDLLPLLGFRPEHVPSLLTCSLTTENQQPILNSTFYRFPF